MTTEQFGCLTLVLFLLLVGARLLGEAFVKLRQPRVIGEILAGIVLGPSLLGHLAPGFAGELFQTNNAQPNGMILSYAYNLGLLLLMLASGAEIKRLFHQDDRREIAWLGAIGTGVPFVVALGAMPLLPIDMFAGTVAQRTPLILVLSIAVAVTSIPVISKILYDLDLLNTRFARLIIGVAVMEDIVLWVFLAVAISLAKDGNVPLSHIVAHVAVTVAYFGVGLLLMPSLIHRLTAAPWNVLVRHSAMAYIVTILFAFSAVALWLDVNLVFAAFLAGYALAKAEDERICKAMATLTRVSFAVFIPVYFAIVGYRLDLTKTLSLVMLVTFFFASSAIKIVSAGLGAKLARFPAAQAFDLAVTLNARGGPGIVLASMAYDAGIINAAFYTTLVLVAVLTSQVSGAWLAYRKRAGAPLLNPATARDLVQP